MKLQDVIGGMFGLIFVFLILNNSKATATVISSLSSAVTNDTAVLQGRGSVSSGGSTLASTGGASLSATFASLGL